MGEEKRKREGAASDADKPPKSPRPTVGGKSMASMGLEATGVMAEEKRKREWAASEAHKAPKSPRPTVGGKSLASLGLEDVQPADAPQSDSSGSSEETTSSSSSGSDSAGNSGRCEHVLLDSEEVDIAVFDINDSDELPTCHYAGCGITWKGAVKDKEGMMKCLECHYIACAQGVVREDPRGHALSHYEKYNHCIAQWYDEPNLGYCFECAHVMRLSDNPEWSKDECAEEDRKVEAQRAMVASKTVVASKSKVDLPTVASSSKVDLGTVARNKMDRWAIGDGYIIRGMPNYGNTCYMNASLQCLLALGKMRTIILREDARLGILGLHLKELFLGTKSENKARNIMDPKTIVDYMFKRFPKRFVPKEMEDSHEFLTSLRVALDKEMEDLNLPHVMEGRDDVFSTFGHSIFSGKLVQTISCKGCSSYSATDLPLNGLELAVPSKDSPARSKSLQVDSTQNNGVPQEIIELPIALDFIPNLFDDTDEMEESAADSQNPEDKEKAWASDIVHDEAKHINSLGSIEDCLTLFFHELKKCENCSKVAEVPETNGSKNVEPIMARTNVNTTVDGDQTELSDRETCRNERSSSDNIATRESTSGTSCDEKDLASCSAASEKAESSEGVKKSASCLPTDRQTDLPSAQDIQDTSTQKQGSGKHVLDDHSAQQVEETRNVLIKLPPVLIVQLKRYISHLSKLKGHVSFKEILQLGRFMDPSSEDKDKSSYRLVGVIVHCGDTPKGGHYIAYVRGSGPSWVCASDDIIREASLHEVLGCEAYILFYEQMGG